MRATAGAINSRQIGRSFAVRLTAMMESTVNLQSAIFAAN
jgi:hypothetical protein